MSGTIGIDFNGLRLNLANDFNDVIQQLNDLLGDKYITLPYTFDKDSFLEAINGLRQNIWLLTCLQDEKNGIESIWEKVKLDRLSSLESEE